MNLVHNLFAPKPNLGANATGVREEESMPSLFQYKMSLKPGRISNEQ
jgi:hypothetical protein